MGYAYDWDVKSEPPLDTNDVDKVRKLIGIPLRRVAFNTEASRIAIVRFVRGIGDINPLWLEEEYGRGTRWGCMLAPPTWLYTVDNTVVAPGLRGIHTLYTGASWEFFRPVRLGDNISSEARLVDVQEKNGRFCGRMVLQAGEVIYRNQRGQVVAKCLSKVMRCPRKTAKERKKYHHITKYRYSHNELEAIENSYAKEHARGSNICYWEDIQVSEDITPVVRGPLNAEDMLCFLNATMPVKAFSIDYRHRLHHPADYYHNPETGLPDFSQACLIDDVMAKQCGFPAAHDTGIQRVAYLGSLMTNWMGDDGWLKSLNVEIHLPFIYGDTSWCRGRVISKEVKDGKHLVKCQLSVENQRQEITAMGEAIVELVSRGGNGTA